MVKKKTYITSTGEKLTDEDIYRIAEEIENKEYGIEDIKRRGRPYVGSGPARLVPVRLDPETYEKVKERVAADHVTTSQLIRDALNQYLAS